MGGAIENIDLFDPVFRLREPMKQKPGPTKPHWVGREDIPKPGNSIQVALGSDKPGRNGPNDRGPS
jgi:hypothetical protein